MQSGYRFRCYPTSAQAHALVRWIGCQRFIYNAKVGEDRYFRAFARKSLQHAGQFAPQDQAYAQFISDVLTPWLREVPSQVLRNGAVRWRQAYARYYRKLAGRPTIQKKHGPQSVWLTSELFAFDLVGTTPAGEAIYRLRVGTSKHPVGEIQYTAHRDHALPASLTLTVDNGHWFLSFSCEDETALPSPQETADWLATFSRQDLKDRAVGLDRGVAVPVMTSRGQRCNISEIQMQRIERKQKLARRWQKRLSRRTKGSANARKAVRRIAAARRYEKDVHQDFAHQTSHAIVSDPSVLLIVFEALGVQRMTRRPKAKQDENGRWQRNGAVAKAGLNRAILSSAWAKTHTYCAYKSHRAGKLSIEVPAHRSSQECSRCGFTHPDNRPTQSEFVCLCCGHVQNADHNASEVIRERGVDHVLSGGYREKDRKKTMRLRKKETVGAGRPEFRSVETSVRHRGGNAPVLGSTKQKGASARNTETHTSTCVAG